MKKIINERFHIILLVFKEYNEGLEFYFKDFYLRKIENEWRKFLNDQKMYLYSDKNIFLKYSEEEINFNNIVNGKDIDEDFFPVKDMNTMYILYDKKLFNYLKELKIKFDKRNKKLLNLLFKQENYKLLIKKLNKKKTIETIKSELNEIIIGNDNWAFKEDNYWNFYKTDHKNCNRLLLREDFKFCPSCGVKIEWE